MCFNYFDISEICAFLFIIFRLFIMIKIAYLKTNFDMLVKSSFYLTNYYISSSVCQVIIIIYVGLLSFHFFPSFAD